jgi:hypothetical protein
MRKAAIYYTSLIHLYQSHTPVSYTGLCLHQPAERQDRTATPVRVAMYPGTVDVLISIIAAPAQAAARWGRWDRIGGSGFEAGWGERGRGPGRDIASIAAPCSAQWASTSFKRPNGPQRPMERRGVWSDGGMERRGCFPERSKRFRLLRPRYYNGNEGARCGPGRRA